ncbi:MAG TPA: glutathione S-transferase family protein [Bdellovibrionota bacterium]|jgi:glutathione S-transferase
MKLYQNPMSPPCRRTLATAYHLNSPVELMTVQFHSPEMTGPDFMKMNPNGSVPILDDNGFHLWESFAIMQYLADKKGDTDFYPKDARKRADIHRWSAWGMCHFGPACGTIVWENYVKPMFSKDPVDAKALQEGTDDFHKYAKVLDSSLAGKKFVCGDTVTLADFMMGANLMYAAQGKLPWDSYKNIQSWYQRLESVDAWKKSTPPKN